jgi:hypothetical protein
MLPIEYENVKNGFNVLHSYRTFMYKNVLFILFYLKRSGNSYKKVKSV